MVLYDALDTVGERALYHDTGKLKSKFHVFQNFILIKLTSLLYFPDSVCFVAKPGYPEPELGQYLGDLTDQLADDYGPDSFCTEFVSAGPKNYAYRVAVGGDLKNIKTVIKVRGISINSSCVDTVTFDNLKDMVLNNTPANTIHIPAQIVRLPGWRIVTRPSSKKWQVCLNKRRRIDQERTVPFGFTSTMLDEDDFDLIDVLDDLYDQ